MQKFYNDFFRSCKLFDQFILEQKWKKVKNKAEFSLLIDEEFKFWSRCMSYFPPERRLIKEYAWFIECYKQIKKNLKEEPINWKMRWLNDEKDTL